MKDRGRNILVGLFVMVALLLLAGMIMVFTGLPELLQRGYPVHMLLDSTHEISTGDRVNMRGLPVGRVVQMSYTDGDVRKGITVTLRIGYDIDLPGNTTANIYTRGFAGGAYIELRPEGPMPIDPQTGQAIAFLPKDGSAVLQGRHFGMELLPGELREDLNQALTALREVGEHAGPALEEFGLLARNLNAFLFPEEDEPGEPTDDPDGVERPTDGPNLQTTLRRLDRMLEALGEVMGDEENQENIRQSLANLAQATAQAEQAMTGLSALAEEARAAVRDVTTPAEQAAQSVDELARRLMVTADSLARVMTTVDQTVAQIQDGEGTAGRLVNDPQLYSNLVDATAELTAALQEVRDLMAQWREQGVRIRWR